VIALAVLAVPNSGAAEPSIPGSATLQSSKPQVTFGGSVRFSGTLSSTGSCRDPREVRLRSQAPGTTTWTPIKTGQTAQAGTFSFGIQPQHSARYDVYLPSFSQCERVVSSPAVPVPVAVKATLTVPPNGVAAGDCGTLKAAVQPPQPGTPVTFQRLIGSTWIPEATSNLGNGTPAAAQVCERWGDLGTQSWRAVWDPSGTSQNAPGTPPTAALRVVKAPWMTHIDQLIGSRSIGVAVASQGQLLYEHGDTVAHVPASNEKLLLSMALLSRMSPDATLPTTAEAPSVDAKGVIHGSLWLVGRGDPTVTKHRLAGLADAIANAGVKKITGSVRGSTDYFSHDWFAPGWKPDFPQDEVALPTALTYMGNTVQGNHVANPEKVAAAAMTNMLKARGVVVAGKPAAGVVPADLQSIATSSSPPLRQILHDQNVDSVNFDAEVLGKLLGVLASGEPGTIAKGAAAIHAFASTHGASTTNEDGSGLSYSDRATALGFVKLLQVAQGSPWGPVLRATLPRPGVGTLEHRLNGIDVQAKTGTLDNVSALSGWVGLTATGRPAVFSILSGGFDESAAKDIEDGIVTTLADHAH
jgi:D-alanyl-D-alanine carboxypeptidase/D-alanyl-D-alanine-endopeptidase (penicillin-binding protein 4)